MGRPGGPFFKGGNMSHKRAKKERKMGSNNQGQPPQLPPIQAQVVINYHGGEIISIQGIPNIPLMFVMLGKAIASIGSRCQIKEQSPIMQVPPGARIVP